MGLRSRTTLIPITVTPLSSHSLRTWTLTCLPQTPPLPWPPHSCYLSLHSTPRPEDSGIEVPLPEPSHGLCACFSLYPPIAPKAVVAWTPSLHRFLANTLNLVTAFVFPTIHLFSFLSQTHKQLTTTGEKSQHHKDMCQ